MIQYFSLGSVQAVSLASAHGLRLSHTSLLRGFGMKMLLLVIALASFPTASSRDVLGFILAPGSTCAGMFAFTLPSSGCRKDVQRLRPTLFICLDRKHHICSNLKIADAALPM